MEVLGQVLLLLLHLLQGVGHILHPTVVVLQGFLPQLTGILSVLSSMILWSSMGAVPKAKVQKGHTRAHRV